MQSESTKDYDRFRMMTSNRRVSRSHVKELFRSMEQNPDLFQYRPILVNKEMFIIDGQHRFTAAKQLGVAIWYTVAPDLTIKDTQAMNMSQRNWTPFDFAKSFAALGNKNYQIYLKFREDFPHFSHNVLQSLLSGSVRMGGGSANKDFKAGEFVITPEEVQEAHKHAEMLEDIYEIADPLRDTKSSGFYIAAMRMFKSPEYNHENFLTKLKQQTEIRYQANAKGYMRDLEDIYNYKKNIRVRFF